MKKGYFVLLTVLFFLGLSQSCRVVKGIRVLNQEKVKVYHFSNGEKEVTFMAMHHIGKHAFYDKVKETVITYQNKGYTVYEEGVEPSELEDSTLIDTEARKERKLFGFDASAEGYGKAMEDMGNNSGKAVSSYLEKLRVQPSYSEMGADSTSQKADVTMTQIIKEYERLHGEIELDSIDLYTPLDSAYKMKKVKMNALEKVILDYRNVMLAQDVLLGDEDKILIMYGENHRKGLLKELKKADDRWKYKGKETFED